MAIRCKKNIFRLEISINQIPFVHVSNSTTNFSGIHPKQIVKGDIPWDGNLLCSFFWKTAFSLKMKEKFPSIDKVKNKIKSIRCLERIIERYQKWVFHIINQDLAFAIYMLRLVFGWNRNYLLTNEMGNSNILIFRSERNKILFGTVWNNFCRSLV